MRSGWRGGQGREESWDGRLGQGPQEGGTLTTNILAAKSSVSDKLTMSLALHTPKMRGPPAGHRYPKSCGMPNSRSRPCTRLRRRACLQTAAGRGVLALGSSAASAVAAGCSKLICEPLSPISGAPARCVRGARACGLQLSAQAKTAASTAALIPPSRCGRSQCHGRLLCATSNFDLTLPRALWLQQLRIRQGRLRYGSVM